MYTVEDLKVYSIGFVRAYPIISIVFFILFGFIFKLDCLLFLVPLVLLPDYANSCITKPIIHNICTQLDIGHISARPKGAKNCGAFIDEYNINKLSNTYGMPSGHSLSSMIISFFLIGYILDHHEKNIQRYILIVVVFLLGLSICISRVYLNCHTTLQIIIGGILGSLIGYYGYSGYKIIKQKKIMEKFYENNL